MYYVSIIIYRGKAYLPVQAIFESGIGVNIEPVYTSELSVDELVTAIEKVIAAVAKPCQTQHGKNGKNGKM